MGLTRPAWHHRRRVRVYAGDCFARDSGTQLQRPLDPHLGSPAGWPQDLAATNDLRGTAVLLRECVLCGAHLRQGGGRDGALAGDLPFDPPDLAHDGSDAPGLLTSPRTSSPAEFHGGGDECGPLDDQDALYGHVPSAMALGAPGNGALPGLSGHRCLRICLASGLLVFGGLDRNAVAMADVARLLQRICSSLQVPFLGEVPLKGE